MASRLNPKHDQKTREKIQTTQLINRLISHVNGSAELSATQVRAAEILLKKTLPDLQSVQLAGTDADGNPSEIVIRVVKPGN
jgi:hypothetical protein